MFCFWKKGKEEKLEKYTVDFDICDDVLHYILSFIDIKELCTQTCLVDKRFKRLSYRYREIYENDMRKRLVTLG